MNKHTDNSNIITNIDNKIKKYKIDTEELQELIEALEALKNELKEQRKNKEKNK